MRLRDPRLWLGLASLGLVLVLFTFDYERTSPGPLSAVHAQVEALQGSEGCAACHGGWRSSLATGCRECHAEIDEQLVQGTGLHGRTLPERLGADAAQRCGTCHAEHEGSEIVLAGDRAFALAGWSARADFDHAHVDFELMGAHTPLACARCHELADAALLAEGQTRFLGLEQTCTHCHSDPHGGRFARSCETCHGQEQPFGELASFTHVASFPLEGAHARAACVDCHAADGPFAVEALAGHAPPPPARSCQDCHASPHADSFTSGVGRALSLASGDTCGACHSAQADSFAAEATRMDAELHAASGFPLEQPHQGLGCGACHAGPANERAARFPGRSADDCAACHVDPHGGQFEEGAFAGRGCTACHARTSFAPTHFDVAQHARTGFALEGSHASVACAACHAQPAPGSHAVRVFKGTPRSCAACHDGDHDSALGGAFADSTVRADCSACHLPTRFAEVDREAFDHQRWTAFALDGAHERANCSACHAATLQPGSDGRTFGHAGQMFAGPVGECATCHVDAHRGAFDEPSSGPDGAHAGCARCHSTESFAAGARVDFDHGLWTGFALAGGHARASCASCHGPGTHLPASPAGARGVERSLGFALDALRVQAEGCAACHVDPHDGFFAEAAALDPDDVLASCVSCHSVETFAGVDRQAFDHGRWTGFALLGAHGHAACESCHRPEFAELPALPKLGGVRGSACADCHADPHAGQFARAGRSDCAQCHRTDGGFEDLEFDHQRDARFALDARHAKLACSACHVPWPLADGSSVVRYKPLGTACIDCHDHGGKQSSPFAERVR